MVQGGFAGADGGSEERCLTGRWTDQSHETTDRRCLSRTVRSQIPEDFTRAYLESNVLDGLDIPEALTQRLDRYWEDGTHDLEFPSVLLDAVEHQEPDIDDVFARLL